MKSLIFEVISSVPDALVTSVVHSISLKKVTADDSVYIEWKTDFSSDITREVIVDSSFKRQEAFNGLQDKFLSILK